MNDDDSPRLTALRKLYPEAFDGDKVDFERLQAAVGGVGGDEVNERYGLSWVGKEAAVQLAAAKADGTLVPDRSASVGFDRSVNAVVEGDNLEVLKILQRAYYGRVRLIFIDPPYNTGNQFLYRDHFRDRTETYLRKTGQANDGGRLTSRPETGGRLHSTWLSMMYPRLLMARNLLRSDGFLVVSIDDNEVHNLRHLLDEIFGPENFVANAVWHKAYVANMTARHVSSTHDHIVVYAKDASQATVGRIPRSKDQLAAFTNPDDDPRGPWKAENLSSGKPYSAGHFPISTPSGREVLPPSGRSWRCHSEQYETWRADGRIWFGKRGDGRPMLKKFLSEVRDGLTPETWWSHTEVGTNKEASTALKKLFGGKAVFDTPKPVRLLERIIALFASRDALIFDFFAGAGVTAEAVLRANRADGGDRRFVLVQLPEAVDNGFGTIAEICRERIRRVLATHQDPSGYRAFKLARSGWTSWECIAEGADLATRILAAVDRRELERNDSDRVWEIALRAAIGLDAPLTSRAIADQRLWVVDSALVACFDTPLKPATMAAIREISPDRLVLAEGAFAGDESARQNALFNLRGEGIEVRVV